MKSQLVLEHRQQQIKKRDSKIISHITRVNSVGHSSKMIVPKEIIRSLGLNWKHDYIEWRIVNDKMVVVRRLNNNH